MNHQDPIFSAGGWREGNALITWGDGLRRWAWPRLTTTLLRSGRIEAACPFAGGYALQVQGRLMWWRRGAETLIEEASAAVDLLETRLFGRHGLLVVHRGMQLRFYQAPRATEPVRPHGWPYRELYSFYTSSEQGGLLIQDVNRDGRPDILCGNYWLQAPPEFAESWRLFAINLFHETPLAASARLAWFRGRLLWLESKSARARASWFTPPPDPRQLWIETPLEIDLRYPRGVTASAGRIWIAEAAPESPRLWSWPDGTWRPLPEAAAALVACDGVILAVGPAGRPWPVAGGGRYRERPRK